MFFDLQEPGAVETGRPLISLTFSPINLQHLQLPWFLHGFVSPLFFPNAMDFKTDSLQPIFAPVFSQTGKLALKHL